MGEQRYSFTHTRLTLALVGGEARHTKLSGNYLNMYLKSTSFSYIPNAAIKKFGYFAVFALD